jgi:hypothetical protein
VFGSASASGIEKWLSPAVSSLTPDGVLTIGPGGRTLVTEAQEEYLRSLNGDAFFDVDSHSPKGAQV